MSIEGLPLLISQEGFRQHCRQPQEDAGEKSRCSRRLYSRALRGGPVALWLSEDWTRSMQLRVPSSLSRLLFLHLTLMVVVWH